MKKLIVIIMALLIVLCLFPAVSLAAPFTISTSGTYDLDDFGIYPSLTIDPGLNVTFVGDSGTQYNFCRFICGEGVSLTIQDIHIESPSSGGFCAISFTGTGNTLTIEGTNVIGGSDNVPCVRVEAGTELTINGTGSLQVTGGYRSAGIGGGSGNGCGSIIITGGHITATGNGFGAGIGGGQYGDGGTIRISGGTVVANGGSNGAGIGGGFQGNGGTVIITGGDVTARGDTGAGIGGGSSGGISNGGSGGNITISCGVVRASSFSMGAGIGGGWDGDGGIVTISGGSVEATGGWGGAGIGGGWRDMGGTVVIEGGSVKAAGGTGAADIGAGKDSAGGGTLDVDNCAEVELTTSGTNAAVTLGDCYIIGAGAGALSGAYIGGTAFIATVIDIGDTGLASGSGYTFSGNTVTIDSSAYDYLIKGETTSRSIVLAPGVETDVVLFDTSIELSPGCAFGIGSGASAALRLVGSNTLTSGNSYAGLQCPDGASLSISGIGSLHATGGDYGAGIGGSIFESGGTILISDGVIEASGGESAAGIGGGNYGSGGNITLRANADITATGGEYGAGIGGGYYFSAGTVLIEGGEISANGGRCGAGIGSGFYADTGGDITITGGTVRATGGDTGAGLGGGFSTDGGSVTIEGGNVTAIGGDEAAGIGGGIFGSGGTVHMSGGLTFAQGGTDELDIGPGYGGSNGALAISGTADVLLRNNSSVSPVTTTHTYLVITELTDGKVYEMTMPDGWTPDFGAYLRFYTLSYHANNGLGTAPDAVTQYKGTANTVENGSGLSRTYYEFSGWNTKADGSGAAYAPGDEFTYTVDSTLYAQWTAKPVLASSIDGGEGENGTIYTGGHITLTPNIPDGTWNWDEEYFSATFNSPATFTALKAGTSTITYTVDGVSISYEVTIEESGLPNTGQDFTWVLISGLAAIAAFVGTVLLFNRKRLSHKNKS